MGEKLFSADSTGAPYIKAQQIMAIIYCMTILLAIPGIIIFVTVVNRCKKCRLDVYSDHIEGIGLQGDLVTEFNFKKEKIESVSMEKGILTINIGASRSYTIMMSTENTVKAKNIINKLINE